MGQRQNWQIQHRFSQIIMQNTQTKLDRKTTHAYHKTVKGGDPLQVDIKFIAKMAGTSPATVSRVLNGTKPVSPALKKKVIDAVEKYNYRPNITARSLILRKSNLIGVLVPNVSVTFHAAMTAAIESEAERNGYHVLVCNISDNFEKEKQTFKMLCGRLVDGIILLHENTPEQTQVLTDISDIPLVLGGIHIPDCSLPCAAIDDEQAAFDATDALLQKEITQVAGLFNNCYSLGTLRLQGFKRALKAHGISADDERIYFDDCTLQGGERTAERIMQGKELPQALFCVSDEMAAGAIHRFLDSGVRVPQDIGVMGFDNISTAQILRPKLSTVAQPIEEIGASSVRLLIDQIENKNSAPSNITLAHQVILRASTGD